MSTMEERRAVLLERMERRAEERTAVTDQRRAEMVRHGHQSELENAPRFMDRFTADTERLKARLVVDDLRKLDPLEQSSAFSEAAEEILQLNRRLTESTMFLPSFDVELSRDMMQQCQQRLADARELLQPKKKFAFGRNRTKAPPKVAKTQGGHGEVPSTETPPSKPKPPIVLGDFGVSERRDEAEEIVLRECAGKDLFLSQLEGCCVRLAGGGKAMRVDNLRRCRVVCGPTAGSIFIDNCQDCVFVFACQQLRIHTTHRSTFYIHVTSKAIIEDCGELRFAPYAVRPVDEVRPRLSAVGLNPDVNNWDKVEDFCHLAVDVASPSWKVLSEEDRECFELL